MNNQISFIVPCGTYPFDILVYIGESTDDLFAELEQFENVSSKELRRLKKKTFPRGYTFMLKGNQTVIYLKQFSKTSKHMATLSHEVYHACCYVLNKVGIKQSNETEEAYAYLIEHITERVYENILTF